MLIIPDIHGRTFWKDVVKGRESEKIIFLGDYLEPYTSYEGITHRDAYLNFLEVLKFKKKHKDNVVLLLGNHDFACIDRRMISCRHDFTNDERNKKLFCENIDLFDIAYLVKNGDMKYVFTHAGIHKKWADRYLKNDVKDIDDISEIVDYLNYALHNDRDELCKRLNVVSYLRGGYDICGSCVWSDIREIVDMKLANTEEYENTIQYVGHTLMQVPYFGKYISCLDCRAGFELDIENNSIKQLTF